MIIYKVVYADTMDGRGVDHVRHFSDQEKAQASADKWTNYDQPNASIFEIEVEE